jgi:uncharacterized Zn finger protein (UPF0148 family)
MTNLFPCPDCELPISPQPATLCPSCQQWRDRVLAEMDQHYVEWKERQEYDRASRRMPTSQRFAEGMADMVKAMERANTQPRPVTGRNNNSE